MFAAALRAGYLASGADLVEMQRKLFRCEPRGAAAIGTRHDAPRTHKALVQHSRILGTDAAAAAFPLARLHAKILLVRFELFSSNRGATANTATHKAARTDLTEMAADVAHWHFHLAAVMCERTCDVPKRAACHLVLIALEKHQRFTAADSAEHVAVAASMRQV